MSQERYGGRQRARSSRKVSILSYLACCVSVGGIVVTLALDLLCPFLLDGKKAHINRILHSREPLPPTLSCHDYGGPDDASEMVYWQQIPSDRTYTSPFYDPDEEKFLLFDPDVAGFNNKRVALETFVVLAHAMGRTLVLPPRVWWYAAASRTETGQGSPRNGFQDVYDFELISKKHLGIKVITTDEFLEEYVLKGRLRNVHNKEKIEFPPKNRTDWNKKFPRGLRLWLAKVTYTMKWRYEDCITAFPSTNSPEAFSNLKALYEKLKAGKAWNKKNVTRLVDVDGSTEDRLVEMLPEPSDLCLYTEEMQQAEVIYFHFVVDFNKPNYRKDMIRLLTYFYSFTFFENWRQDLHMKRLVRDDLRYRDEFHCAAARIVVAIRELSLKLTNSSEFDTMHIRRSEDFKGQFGRLMPAQSILRNSKEFLKEDSLIYVATDESNRTFFEPLASHYKLVFLSDFQHLMRGFHPYMFGLIEALVAAKGRTFVGTWSSTFSVSSACCMVCCRSASLSIHILSSFQSH
jgi:hypothetical protein